MKRILLLFIIFHTSLAALFAQVRVSVQAPSQVEEGRNIRVSYVVNTNDVDDIQVGDFTGFELLYGPSTSTQSSVSIVNGKMSRNSQVTFTYTLQARQPGTYKLPVATIKSGGQTYKSNQASIQVLERDAEENAASGGGASGHSGARTRANDASAATVSSADLYVGASVSKRQVYEQEAVVLTYKLYTRVNISPNYTPESLELDGFHTQEIELPMQKELKVERVNGRNYQTTVLSQHVLFPQKTGKVTIPSRKFEFEAIVQNPNVDPFDAFFGGGALQTRVPKTVMASAIELQVEPLPSRPANFSGAVGTQFNVSGTLTPEQVDANDAVSLRLTVNGVGNMKLMKAPAVQWPKDFESYDPKTNDKTRIGANGASGNVVYDYTAVPRHGGKYSIPPVEFCYFDTQSKSYRTLRTDSFHVAVAKTAGHRVGRSVNQEDLTVLNSDIRYIKTSPANVKPAGTTFFGTLPYWLSYIGPFALFLLLIAIFERQARANADIARRRGKKAGKAASKRLKSAAKLLKQGDARAFYEEVTRALWGYVGDKLNLPVAELSKDNVGERLAERGVSEESIRRFLQVLGDCEFAQYAPGDPSATMDRLYADATEVINLIENG